MDDQALINDLKKFHGYPPHHEWSNHCCGDGYFAQSLLRKYKAKSIEELEERVNFRRYHIAWRKAVAEFPK